MTKRRRSRARRLVLDIGSSSVRLCEISPTKTGYQLTKYFQREFGIDPAMDEDEQQERRQDVLRGLLKEAKTRTKKVIFGVPGQSVFMRPRALPPVLEHKVNQIVRYEILQQIPFSLDQIAFDYQILNRTEAGGYEVLMAAIKVDVVEKCLGLLKSVKRKVGTVDVCPLAAFNWLQHTGEFGDQEGECVALIDLGATTTDIVVERDGQFRFPRSINFGGNDITKAIARDFNLSFEEAERLKRERGFAPTGDAQRDGKGGQVMGQILGRLVNEINRSFAYFRSQPGAGQVARVVVTGGGACLRNMVPYLQRELGMDVRIAQPLAGLAIGPGAQEVNEHPEQSAVALGLALRCCEPAAIEMNLIPPRILARSKHREQALFYALSALVFIMIMASIIPARARKNEVTLGNISQVANVIRQYDRAMVDERTSPTRWTSEYEDKLDRAKAELKRWKDVVWQMDEFLKGRRDWLSYLNAVADARPEGKEVVINTFESTFISKEKATSQVTPTFLFGDEDDEEDDEDEEREPAGGGAAFNDPFGVGSSGFPGLEPSLREVTVEGEEEPAAPGARGRRSGSRADKQPLPGPVNGVRIRGIAEDSETLLAYVDNLKKCGVFIEGGVYFSPASANPVGQGAAAGRQSQAMAVDAYNLTSDADEEEERNQGGGALFQGRGPRETGTFGEKVSDARRTFVINLQFSGTAIDLEAEEEKEESGPRPASRGPRRSLLGGPAAGLE